MYMSQTSKYTYDIVISVFIVNIYMKVLVFILLCLCKYGVQPPGVRKMI